MNHLFLIVDDLNLALGCYGHPAAYTPNIDRLAARGSRFASTFCPYPLCGPSRSAMLTGQRPESFPMPNNEVAWRDLRPDLRTLPQLFREAGYHTAGFGKIFHHGIQAKDLDAWRAAHPDAHLPHTFEDPASWDDCFTGKPAGFEENAHGPEQVLDGHPHGGTSLHSVRCTNPEVLPDTLAADRAIAFLNNLKSEISDLNPPPPFFLAVGFHKPHVPFIAPEKWWAYYDSLDVESLRPPTWFQPASVPTGTFKQERFHRDLNEEQRQHCYKGYLACVSWMDEQLGRVLAALEAEGLAGNTLISFVADHGYHIGEQAQWDKMQLLDPALHVPLILAGPGIPAGQVVTAVNESLDLFPTLRELHGINPKQPAAGKSLLPWLKDPAKPSARHAFAWVNAGPRQGWSVRTERYRYGLTSWKDGTPAPYLFDYATDPHETTNLLVNGAQHPAAADLDAQLRAHFDTIH
ncbi:MAG: sulfatase [Oceanipulchritudo sp.]